MLSCLAVIYPSSVLIFSRKGKNKCCWYSFSKYMKLFALIICFAMFYISCYIFWNKLTWMITLIGKDFVFLNIFIQKQFQFLKIKVTLLLQSYIFGCLVANYKIYAAHIWPFMLFSGTLPKPWNLFFHQPCLGLDWKYTFQRELLIDIQFYTGDSSLFHFWWAQRFFYILDALYQGYDFQMDYML